MMGFKLNHVSKKGPDVNSLIYEFTKMKLPFCIYAFIKFIFLNEIDAF